VSLARAGRQQLEQLFAQERADRPPIAKTWDGSPREDDAFDETAAPPAKDTASQP